MADPIIRVKRSTVQGKIPTNEQLGLGEIAINHYDGKVFIRQDTGGVGVGTTVISIGNSSSGLGPLNGLVIGNDSTGADIYQRENLPLDTCIVY